VIVRGEVKIAHASQSGSEVVFSIAGPGDVLGEMSIFEQEGTRTADAQALGQAECLIIARAPLIEFISTRPALLLHIISTLSGYIKRKDAALGEASFLDIPARVALKLVELEDNRLMLPGLADEFAGFKAPREPRYALVGSIDSVILLRRNLKSLIAGDDLRTLIQGDKNRIEIGSVADLPSHAILDRGRIVGLWEYDPDSESIAWAAFRKPDAGLKKAVQEMEAWILTDLGDARSFSLDSPKSRAPRLAALRAGF